MNVKYQYVTTLSIFYNMKVIRPEGSAWGGFTPAVAKGRNPGLLNKFTRPNTSPPKRASGVQKGKKKLAFPKTRVNFRRD